MAALEPQIAADLAVLDPVALAVKQKMLRQVRSGLCLWGNLDWAGFDQWFTDLRMFLCFCAWRRAATEAGEGEGQGHLEEGASAHPFFLYNPIPYNIT